MIKFILYCALLISSINQLNAEQDSSAYRWILLMNKAMNDLTYSGTFIHQQGAELQAMSLIHVQENNIEKEQLFSLNGASVKLLRNQYQVVLIHTNPDGTDDVKHFESDKKFSSLVSLRAEKLIKNYRLLIMGKERIANRVGQVINIVPKDQLRYGYHLVLDEKTALPLDMQVISKNNEVISRMMFTQLEIGGDYSNVDFSTPPKDKISQKQSTTRNNLAPTKWIFNNIPNGFTMNIRRFTDNNGLTFEHFLFSDGITSVSIYIENKIDEEIDLDGIVKIDAMTASGKEVGSHQIIAIGEVPKNTLDIFINNMVLTP